MIKTSLHNAKTTHQNKLFHLLYSLLWDLGGGAF